MSSCLNCSPYTQCSQHCPDSHNPLGCRGRSPHTVRHCHTGHERPHNPSQTQRAQGLHHTLSHHLRGQQGALMLRMENKGTQAPQTDDGLAQVFHDQEKTRWGKHGKPIVPCHATDVGRCENHGKRHLFPRRACFRCCSMS